MFPKALLGAVANIAAVQLPSQPQLAPWMSVVDLGDGRVQLRAADFALTIADQLLSRTFQHIAPMLDGEHFLEAIIKSGGEKYLEGTIEFVLKLLKQGGALHEGAPSPELDPDARKRFGSALRLLAHYTYKPEDVLVRLQTATVVVEGTRTLSEKIASALESTGIGTVVCATTDTPSSERRYRTEAADLVIGVADTPNTAFFSRMNESQLVTRSRWLRVALDGRFGILGPLMVPGQTACFTCYLRRRAMHDVAEHFERYQQTVAERGEGYEGVLGGLTDVLAGQAALESARLLGGFAPPSTVGRFYVFQPSTPSVFGHDVLRIPRCTSCGPSFSPRDPWDLRAQRQDGEA